MSVQILVCGSREWTDRGTIQRELATLPKSSVIIHGACRGADTIAAEEGEKLGLKIIPYPVLDSDWVEFGLAAGPMRNTKMILEGNPQMILVFHQALGKSKGSRDMVRKAREKSVPVKIVTGCRSWLNGERKTHAKNAARRKKIKTSLPESGMCMVCGSRNLENIQEKIICQHCKTINDTCCG